MVRRNQVMIAIGDGITISRCAFSSRLHTTLAIGSLSVRFHDFWNRRRLRLPYGTLPPTVIVNYRKNAIMGQKHTRKGHRIHQRHIMVVISRKKLASPKATASP